MVHILATGVFFTGFLKDMLSLPRPLSPPLHRITMSGSAALEYGFPSTHSANAVSVAVYTLFSLHSPDCTLQPTTRLILESLSYFYAFSIVLGRLYCGMHGFFDVIVGSIMGALVCHFALNPLSSLPTPFGFYRPWAPFSYGRLGHMQRSTDTSTSFLSSNAFMEPQLTNSFTAAVGLYKPQ